MAASECAGPGKGLLHATLYTVSIAVAAATLVADFSVGIEHWFNTYQSWAYFTLSLIIVPSCFIQVLSLKWYHISGELKQYQWISHIFQLAIIHRFCFLLKTVMKTDQAQIKSQRDNSIARIENDTFILNLFTSLLVSVPQIIFQIHVISVLQKTSFWTSASVITSIFSLTWALITYSLLSNEANQNSSYFTWSLMMIQGFWRGGMLASRIAALILATSCFKAWILVIFGIHTLGMTAWIIQQSTDACVRQLENLAYKCLIGVVYFFDYFKLTDNQIRNHVCIFYSVMMIQNTLFYAVYLIFFKNIFQKNIFIVSTVMILGGSFIGAVSMIMHFCMFQNIKTIKLCKRNQMDPEVSMKISPSKSIGKLLFKKRNSKSISNDSAENISSELAMDKKSILSDIAQSTESLEKGIINTSFIKCDETNVMVQVIVEDSKVTNVDVSTEKVQGRCAMDKKSEDVCNVDLSLEGMDQIKSSSADSLHRQKRRGICSEIELNFDSSECNLDPDAQFCSQKRRGICSLTQLGLELVTDEDNYVEKSFSSLDKLKSNSEVSLNIEDKTLDSVVLDSLPIKNLAINDNCDLMIPENILIRGRLNTPVISESSEATISNQLSEKENDSQKQLEEETMSHVTSIHDYENLCPLGVARPPWCIRSWKGYTDIETYIHDDSIVRDRRRDTLTSTATGTTLSSDFSDATYASFRKIMKRSRQDDYLDTLIYDLADWESISNKAPIEEISTATVITDAMEEQQDQTNLFSAKPIVIDEKGGMLALDTILEEREDPSSSIPELRMNLGRPNGCSVSSLVATIDEIRKCTADNSPRHVYHRTESQWEDLEQKILIKRTHFTKVLFANDYSNVTINCKEPWSGSFLRDTRSDKLSILREVTNYCLKDSSDKTPLINAILSDSPILAPKTETQNCEAVDLIEENNVYVDMNALGAQKCSNEVHKEHSLIDQDVLSQNDLSFTKDKGDEFCGKSDTSNRRKVAFLLTDEIINDSTDNSSEKSESSTKSSNDSKSTPFCIDRRGRTISRPRRKFSLLRERFEPKNNEQIVCVVSPNNLLPNKPELSSLNKHISVILNDSNTFDSNHDKENLTTKSALAMENKNIHPSNLKEKRSVFLKQVLSPPKFQGWGKKRTFSPNAKIIPKAH